MNMGDWQDYLTPSQMQAMYDKIEEIGETGRGGLIIHIFDPGGNTEIDLGFLQIINTNDRFDKADDEGITPWAVDPAMAARLNKSSYPNYIKDDNDMLICKANGTLMAETFNFKMRLNGLMSIHLMQKRCFMVEIKTVAYNS